MNKDETEDRKPTVTLGATGEYPDGKLNEADEGAAIMAIGHGKGRVIVDFGQPVAWVGLSPQEAVTMAQYLINQARQAAHETGEILEVKL